MAFTLAAAPFAQQILKYPVQSILASEQAMVFSAAGYTEWLGGDPQGK